MRQISMRVRRFGSTDLHVSEFGLGCARIGGIFKREPGEFVNLLTGALDAGINFFDTADIYSQGESEVLLGRAFGQRRDRVIIASKAGYVLPSQRRMIARIKPLIRPVIKMLGLSRAQLPSALRGSLAQNFTPAHLRRSVDGSLRRLRTNYLDLFQLHSAPVDVVEQGEWVETLEALKHEGKIRYYGISCDTVAAAAAALNQPGVSSLQVVANLLERDAVPLIARAGEKGIGVIARECLANGLLVKDASGVNVRSYTRTETEAGAKARQIESYRTAAAENGSTLAQLALQFVSGLEGVSVSLIGVSSLEQLNGLLSNAFPLPELSTSRAIPYFP